MERKFSEFGKFKESDKLLKHELEYQYLQDMIGKREDL